MTFHKLLLQNSFRSVDRVYLPQYSKAVACSCVVTYFQRRYESVKVKTPAFPESIIEGTLSNWTKKIGDQVRKDEEIASIETDKVDTPVIAPAKGILKEIFVSEGDTVRLDQDLALLNTDGIIETAKPKALAEEPDKASKSKAGSHHEENKSKSGSQHEETKYKSGTPQEDFKSSAESLQTSDKFNVQQTLQDKSLVKATRSEKSNGSARNITPPTKKDNEIDDSTDSFPSRSEERIKMTRMRRRTAERLKESQNRAASLTTFNEVDMSSVIEMRSKYNEDLLKKHGVKMGFMSAFLKAVCQGIKQVPAINAAIEGPGNGDTLVYKNYVDISVAVATPKGLVTPVVRNAEQKDLLDIEKEIIRLGKKARDGQLAMEDLAGGTFTVSNGGIFGSLMGTPILNSPQTAVLGLHAVNQRPIAINGEVKVRPMMYLALTYDHRVVDGREAVTFLKLIKEFVEDPRRMLIS